jgi:aldose 1-epimerase
MKLTSDSFGNLPNGKSTTLYTLINDKGMKVSITDYGALITSICVPDKNGDMDDVVLGFDSIDGYVSELYTGNKPYFGATVGRYSNRIKSGKFSIDGREYQVSQNEGDNTVHGGFVGFDQKVWSSETIENSGEVGIRFSCESADGEEGYPGKMKVSVEFKLNNENALSIKYDAVCDKDTVVSLTNHSYFNLAGAGNGDIRSHTLLINSGKCLDLEEGFIPTGKIVDVAGTDLDFISSPKIGPMIDMAGNHKDLGCYAHTWVFDVKNGELLHAGTLTDQVSGRTMEIHTTEPGMLLYTGDGLDGSLTGKLGKVYQQWGGLCLETQQLPDAPNHPDFPSSVLRKGETFSSKTVYAFGIG